MSQSSDDESSSSSSNEFLVAPDKIDLESSYFQGSPSKSKGTAIVNKDENDSDDSDNDFEYLENEKADTNALLAEVMKNLESTQKANAPYSDDVKAVSSSIKQESSPKKSRTLLSNEIANLLMQGESGKSSLPIDEDGEEQDEEESNGTQPADYTIPKEGVNIILPGTDMIFRKQKKQTSVGEMLRKRMNQRLRSNQVFIHKTGLLCWLAHGFHINREINDPEVLSTALSLVPSTSYPKGRADLKYLEQFTKWFKNLIKLEFKDVNEFVRKEILLVRLKEKRVHNYRELVLLCIATLRAIGLTCRLVISLYPPALKLNSDQLFQNPSKQTKDDKNKHPSKTSKSKVTKQSSNKGKKSTTTKGKSQYFADEESNSTTKGKSQYFADEESNSKFVPENSSELDKTAKMDAKKRALGIFSKFANTPNKKSVKTIIDKKSNSTEKSPEKKDKNKNSPGETESKAKTSENIKIDIKSPPRTRQLRSRTIEQKSKTETAKQNKKTSVDKETNKDEEKPTGRRKRVKIDVPSTSSKADEDSDDEVQMKTTSAKRKTIKSPLKGETITDDSDEDFQPKPPPKRRRTINFKNDFKSEASRSIDSRVLSSDDEDAEIVDVKGAQNIWIEVYLESEESWISISIPNDKIHCVSDIYKKAPKPVLYVVAWNPVGTLKDITRRYCPHWLTVTRKQRVDENWWKETLHPWKEKNTPMSKAEDERLLQSELEQPLPKTMGECKGHPLYVLTRHLLKFEALYPPDCVPIGYLKNGEAIYSRHCVHTLCSRETWIKNARVVKPAQEAYKIVKAMAKYDKLSGAKLADQPLELFGKWQTTQYEPPEAKDGKVPRNEYGNVDLFQQCMLPKGTVHINLPGLNRIARKLNIDCSPAVVGFNFGCRGALPAFEGFVVCEEYEDTLREAWESEQAEAEKRAREKREKRIYGNWRKLIRGLFIREKLASRYDFKDNDDENESEKKPSASTKNPKGSTKRTKKL